VLITTTRDAPSGASGCSVALSPPRGYRSQPVSVAAFAPVFAGHERTELNERRPGQEAMAAKLGCGGPGLVEERISGGIGPCERVEVQLAGAVKDGLREIEISAFQRSDAVEESAFVTGMGDESL